jgi:hypothetical protein
MIVVILVVTIVWPTETGGDNGGATEITDDSVQLPDVA